MKCWNCGLDTMSPWETLGKGWFKCSDCGATWTKIPKPGQAISQETIIHSSGKRSKHFKAKLARSKVKE